MHVVADVVGYYAKPLAGALTFTTVSGTAVSVPASGEASSGILTCPAGYTAVSFAFSAAGGVVMKDSYLNANNGSFFVYSKDAVATTMTPKLNCIQIPGR